jgi:oligosaccharide repeat unit polymerase
VFFGVAALAQMSQDRYPLVSAVPYTESQLQSTQFRIAIGIACYLLGRYLWRVASRRRRSVARWDRLRYSDVHTQIVGVLGIAGAVLVIAKTGLRPFFSSRDELSLALYNARGSVRGYRVYDLASKGTGGLEQLVVNIPAFVALLYLLASGRWRRHKLLFALAVVVNLITNNPISNARYWTGVVVVGLLAAFIDLNRRSRHVYFALGLVMSTLFSLGFLGLFRSPEAARRGTDLSAAHQIVSSPDYAMFQQELNATRYVEQHGFTGGKQIAAAVFVYVPRAIWHSKPGDTGDVVGKEVGANVSSTLWTEFFIDFGYVGLLIGFVILGYLFAYLDHVFHRSSSIAARLIVPIAAAYSILFLRGSLQPAIAYGAPIFVVMLLCLRRARSAELQEQAAQDELVSAR